MGEATWHHLGGLFTSIDIGVADPRSEDELTNIAAEYEGDAVFFFAHWGSSAISDFARTNPADFDDRISWLRRQFEAMGQ